MPNLGKEELMLKMFVTIVVLSFSSGGLAAPVATAVVADRAVAIVGNTVLTASDVRLHKALIQLDPSEVPIFKEGPGSAQEHAIQATAIRIMAGKIPVYQPSQKQTKARLERFEDQWETPDTYRDFLRTHGLSPERLATVLRRRQIVERVAFRALGLPSDDPEEWSQRFEVWLKAETKSVMIRLIAAQTPLTEEP